MTRPLRELPSCRVLVGGEVSAYAGHNTCADRARALGELVGSLTVVDWTVESWSFLDRLRRAVFRWGGRVAHPHREFVSRRLVEACAKGTYDLIWLDKAVAVSPSALSAVRRLQPEALIVGYSPDDMSARHNHSQEFLNGLAQYDAFVTTKSYNVVELGALGARRVLFIDNAFSEAVFRPMPVGEAEVARLGGDVGFIGTYEEARARSMLRIAEAGINVRVWGGGWQKCHFSHPNLRIEGRPLYGDDFARACCAFRINLGFLRKLNRDLQTTRSVEIPACRAFMLAERTAEHARLFVEGKEAEFFGSDEELVQKCRHYLTHEEARRAIADGGFHRCVTGGYSNTERLRQVLVELGGS